MDCLRFDDDEGLEAALRLRKEFEQDLDPRLRALILEVARWQYEQWGIPLTITCIIRAFGENEAVGGKPKSAHVRREGQKFARASDWRNRDLTPDQQQQRRDYVLTYFNWKVPLLFHCIDHDSGHGEHTHININFSYMV